MADLKRILLVEDSLRDAELALDALALNHLANEVVHVQDGAEALDYLFRRGRFFGRTNGQPAVVLLDLKMPKVDGIEVLRQIKGDPGQVSNRCAAINSVIRRRTLIVPGLVSRI